MTGLERTKRTWNDIKNRCKNKNSYIRRGVKICKKWEQSFDNFLKDMNIKPEGYIIHRKDHDLDYSPDNTIYITQNEHYTHDAAPPRFKNLIWEFYFSLIRLAPEDKEYWKFETKRALGLMESLLKDKQKYHRKWYILLNAWKKLKEEHNG